MSLHPEAIIASFLNEERTLAFHLQVNGELVQIERERPSHAWSPPETVARLARGGDFEDYLASLRQGDRREALSAVLHLDAELLPALMAWLSMPATGPAEGDEATTREESAYASGFDSYELASADVVLPLATGAAIFFRDVVSHDSDLLSQLLGYAPDAEVLGILRRTLDIALDDVGAA